MAAEHGAFTIPNEADVGSDFVQAGVYSADVYTLVGGYNQTGILSGCVVTAQGVPDNTVAVALGSILVQGVQQAVAAGNVTIDPELTGNPRIDLVISNAAGVKSAIKGTAAVNPVAPITGLLDGGGDLQVAVLAQVFIPASENPAVIVAGDIVDKRVLVHQPADITAFFVAANDASAQSKAMADYQCDGVADEVEINQALVDTGANGGEVHLSEGNFELATPIDMLDDTTLTGKGYSSNVHQGGAGANSTVILIDSVDNIMVRHLRARGDAVHSATGLPANVKITGTADNITVEDVYSEQGNYDGILVIDKAAVGAPTNLTIKGCHVTDPEDDGLNLAVQNGFDITDVKIFDNHIWNTNGAGSGAGLHVSRSSGTISRVSILGNNIRDTKSHSIDTTGGVANCFFDFEISNNDLYDSGESALEMQHSERVVISDNNINTSEDRGVYFFEGDHVSITGNVISDTNSDDSDIDPAIFVYDTDDVIINSNIINGVGTSGDGIRITKINSCTINGNEIKGQGGHGIHLTAGSTISQVTIANNIIVGTGAGANFDGIFLDGANVTPTLYVNIIGNVIYDSTDHAISLEDYCSRCIIKNNLIVDAGDYGVHLSANCDDNQITGNYFENSTTGDINIANASCSDNRVQDNRVENKTVDSGTNTIFRSHTIPAYYADGAGWSGVDAYTFVELTKDTTEKTKWNFSMPVDALFAHHINMIFVPVEDDATAEIDVDWDIGAIGQDKNTHNDAEVNQQQAIASGDADKFHSWDLGAIGSPTTLAAALAAGDYAGVMVTQSGAAVTLYVHSLEVVYE